MEEYILNLEQKVKLASKENKDLKNGLSKKISELSEEKQDVETKKVEISNLKHKISEAIAKANSVSQEKQDAEMMMKNQIEDLKSKLFQTTTELSKEKQETKTKTSKIKDLEYKLLETSREKQNTQLRMGKEIDGLNKLLITISKNKKKITQEEIMEETKANNKRVEELTCQKETFQSKEYEGRLRIAELQQQQRSILQAKSNIEFEFYSYREEATKKQMKEAARVDEALLLVVKLSSVVEKEKQSTKELTEEREQQKSKHMEIIHGKDCIIDETKRKLEDSLTELNKLQPRVQILERHKSELYNQLRSIRMVQKYEQYLIPLTGILCVALPTAVAATAAATDLSMFRIFCKPLLRLSAASHYLQKSNNNKGKNT